MLDGARLGIHQFSAASGSLGDGASQVAVVVLAAYLEEMGVERTMLDLASVTSASSMYWMTPNEARQVSIDNTRPALAPWAILSLPQGNAALEVTQRVSHGRRANLRIVVRDGQAFLVATTLLEKAAYGSDRVDQFPIGQSPDLSICAGQRCIAGTPVRAWARTETQATFAMQAIVAFNVRDLQTLSRGKSLSVTDDFGTALSDVTLSTDLSTIGFANGISLLARIK